MKKEILYQKIARTIAWQIKNGVWKVGEKLPSLRTISNENGVSLNTAIQAYYELEKDGFIASRPKSGYVVNYKPQRLSAPATTQPSIKFPGKEDEGLIDEVYHSIEDTSITRFSLGIPEDVLLPIARKGDTIAVESPVYFGILQLANSLGLRVLELPTNPVTGIDPDALRKVLPQINLCLLISNFSNPLGSCMLDEHKKAIVNMLAERDIPLIEW